jgi:hypothetical protein
MRIAEHTFPPEDVMAYLDGELPPARAAAVQAHLAECAICQGVAADVRQVAADLGSWQAPGPSEALTAPRAVYDVVPSRSWFPRRRWRAWALGLAATGAVLIVAAFLVEDDRRQSRIIDGTAGGRAGAPAAGNGRDLLADAGTPGADTTSREAGAMLAQSELPAVQKIVRTANLGIAVTDFETVRPAIEGIVRDVGGFVGHIEVWDAATPRWLQATLRVPAPRLDDALRQLRALGRVVNERQSGEDVTEQVLDLEARLSNARNTERRLNEVLKTGTGNVRDVLEVEREMARVREEIEGLDARRKDVERRVTYATVTLHVTGQRQAMLDIGRHSVRGQVRDAFIDGVQGAYESAAGAVLLALRAAPVLVVWTAVLWWPARAAIRMMRARRAAARGQQGA